MRREALDDVGGFESIRDSIVDDMSMAARMKEFGHRNVFLDAKQAARCHLYSGYRDAFEGIERSVYSSVGGHPATIAGLTVIVLGLICAPALYVLASLARFDVPSGPVAVVGRAVRRCSGRSSRGTETFPWSAFVLYPLVFLNLLIILIASMLEHGIRPGVEWKGRLVRVAQQPWCRVRTRNRGVREQVGQGVPVIAPDDALRAVLALAIGVLLGSVLPADLLARARGIDIRSSGDGNPGTVNAFRVLGLGAGPDHRRLRHVRRNRRDPDRPSSRRVRRPRLPGRHHGRRGSPLPGVSAGSADGGQGMGASAGLLVYGVGIAVSRGWLSAIDLGGLVALLLVALRDHALGQDRRDRHAAGALAILLAIARPDWQFLAFMVAAAAHIWIVQVARGQDVRRRHPSTT